MYRLPQLMVLDLSGNYVGKLDDTVATCSWLKEIDLSGNALADITPAICSLSKLEVTLRLRVLKRCPRDGAWGLRPGWGPGCAAQLLSRACR